MNLLEATSKAKYLAGITQLTHVIYKTNGVYGVIKKAEWTGEVIKQIDYVDIKDETENIPELLDTASEEILSSNGDGPTEIPARKRKRS
jgi:hypothetical protein